MRVSPETRSVPDGLQPPRKTTARNQHTLRVFPDSLPTASTRSHRPCPHAPGHQRDQRPPGLPAVPQSKPDRQSATVTPTNGRTARTACRTAPRPYRRTRPRSTPPACHARGEREPGDPGRLPPTRGKESIRKCLRQRYCQAQPSFSRAPKFSRLNPPPNRISLYEKEIHQHTASRNQVACPYIGRVAEHGSEISTDGRRTKARHRQTI